MKSLFLSAAAFLIFLTILRASAVAPSVTTGNPTNITTNSATLNGTANPNGLATSAYFQWGTTTNYGSVTTPQSLGAGSSPVAVQANLASLLTDTNYHYRLVASNASGIAYGSDVIVTPTLLLYLYAGESWSYVFHDLPLRGQTSPQMGFALGLFTILTNSFSAGGSVRWELFENSTNEVPFFSQVVNEPATGGTGGNAPFNWSDLQGAARLTVLTGSVVVSSVYFQRVGEHVGSFSPVYQNTIVPTRNPQPPSFGTQFVSSVSIQSAVVSADINVKNLPSGVFVQWGTTTNYGSASGAAPVDFDYFVRRDITVNNLVPGTVYHFRFAATNSAGATYGNDLTLSTPINVITQPANNRTTTSAVLNATVTIDGVATTAYFQWGTTTNYGQVTALQNLGSPMTVTNVSAPLTGLTPQTTYHYRAVVFSAGVTNRGTDVAFVTTPPPTNIVVTNLTTDDVRGAIERGGSVTFACDGVLTLSSQLEIGNDLCLDASGHSITFSGSNVTRIFSVLPGTLLKMTNLALVNGKSTNAGGAVYNQGTIFAEGCRFFSNAVVGAAGANGTNGPNGTNSSTCSLITPGKAGGAGGPGQSALGGAFLNSGSLTLSHCYFATNTTSGGAGGVGGIGGQGGQCPPPPSSALNRAGGGVGGAGGAGGAAAGAAIANFGNLVVNNCTFSNSFSGSGAGGTGGAGGLQGTPAQFARGGFGGAGGTAQGGSVFNAGTMFLSNSLFADSTALGASGGQEVQVFGFFADVIPAGNGGQASGGAIYSSNNSIVVNGTLLRNVASGGPYMGTCNCSFFYTNVHAGDATGGAIASAGSFQAVNLSLEGNMALGGLGSCPGCQGSFRPSTNGNSYGGSLANTGGVFQIVNSILSGGTSNNSYGTITDLGHNISSDATPTWTSGTSLNNTDPLLLPLANNGGPTLTVALRAGSPALNTADCTLAPATDQRGYARPSGPGCDIGAYEGPGTPQLQIIYQSSSTNVLRWLAEAGQMYRLETTSDFTGWTPYATNTAGTNGWLDFPVPANPSPRFFRLLAQ